ncbi:MAG: hypothetical protein ACYC2U_00255 [Candidatus Amoebophilus sp.]
MITSQNVYKVGSSLSGDKGKGFIIMDDGSQYKKEPSLYFPST